MAVFTDLTHPRYRQQFSQIEKAYGLTITSIEGISAGSADTKFKISTEQFADPLVLTIHETPDVCVDGLSSQASARMLLYVDYLTNVAPPAVDRFGEKVNLGFLKLLKARPDGQDDLPYLELSFTGIKKTVSIVPFIDGKQFENKPGELVRIDESFLAGRALAGYLTIAQSYPRQSTFEAFDFQHYTQTIGQLASKPQLAKRLGTVLSSRQYTGIKVQDAGREYLLEMNRHGQNLLESWRRLDSLESPYVHTLIHCDFFTDNILLDEDGKLYIIDFGEVKTGPIGLDIGVALNSWAAENGQPVLENAVRFLEGFDEVIALDQQAISMVPLVATLGAFRWETFRIQRMEMEDPAQVKMRSPAEFQSLRQAWQTFQPLFDSAGSISEMRK